MATRAFIAICISFSVAHAANATSNPETLAGEGQAPTVAIAEFESGNPQAVSVQQSSLGAVFEGDMLLRLTEQPSGDRVSPRDFHITTNGSLWPNAVLPYTIDSAVGTAVRSRIASAIEHWNALTPVTVIERTSANQASYPDYVEFTDYPGCASYVGRIGGEQPIYAGSACSTGNIIHEIGHALGLYHEHTRADRDDFVAINWANISSAYSYNFDKITSGAQSSTAYDLGSIMHYGEYFFSNNGQKTIESLYPSADSIGQRVGLSDSDIAGINAMYASGANGDLDLTPTSPYPNQSLNVALRYDNADHTSIAVTSVTVDMPSGTAYVGNNSSDWSCGLSVDEVNCSGPSIAQGDNSTLDLSFTAPATASNALDFFSEATLTPQSGSPITHTAKVSFDMTTTNLAPTIAPGQHIEISSNIPAVGALIGTVNAEDPNGDPIQSWQLLSSDTPGAVSLDTATGQIRIADAAQVATRLDDVIILSVVATDGSLSSAATDIYLDVGTSSSSAVVSKTGDSGGGGGALSALLLLLFMRRRN